MLSFCFMKLVSYLSPDNCASLILLSFLDNELSTLSFLCSNLLGFNGMSELLPEAQACDRDIIKSNVEESSPLSQYLPNLPTHSLKLVGEKGSSQVLTSSSLLK